MYIFEKTDNEMAGVYLSFESPAMNETSKNYGISHLLEHMICESTDDLDETYDENCVHTNAFTGKDEVIFHMTGLSERVNMFKDEYIKRILSYQPTKKDFDKQKPIVMQEYNDWFNNNFKATYTNFLSKHYGFIPSIGTREALDAISFEDVVEFKKNYFSNPTKIIVADKIDTGISAEHSEFVEMIPNEVEPYSYINKDAIINDLSVGIIGASAPIAESSEDYNIRMIAKMLGYGLKSPLYQRLREQDNLCYWVSCFNQYLHNKNIILIGTSAANENIQKIQDGIYEILYNPEKYLTKERYNLMLNNSRASEKIREQYKHEYDYLATYFDKDSVSLRKNMHRISYEGVMDYYMKNLHPSRRNWVFTNQKELYN